MDFDKYQHEASQTALPSAMSLDYLIPGLAAEAGEVAGKWAKYVRDGTSRAALHDDLVKEAGDCLWFLAVLCEHIGVDLEYVAKANINKLQSRQARGVIGGQGDDR